MAYTPEQIAAAQTYLASKPDQQEVFQRDYAGDINRWLDGFLGWWRENLQGVEDLASYAGELKLINDMGITPRLATGQTAPAGIRVATVENGPADQVLFNAAAPQLMADVERDADRAKQAAALTAAALAGTTAAGNQLQRTQGGGFDSQTYLTQYPQVSGLFASLNDGATPGTKSVPTPSGPQDMTAQQFAEFHFQNFGQREGLTGNYIGSPQLTEDLANAANTTNANIAAATQAFNSNLGALSNATTAMQQNLTGSLAEKAAALQAQIQALTQNLDTLDATQRKALADQIASLQANLEQSVNTQREALQTQLATLGTAATAEAQARRAALQTEIAALTAAQAPLADARLKAAEIQATAVNVGLEQTRDQMTADSARAGYLGGSTIQDANLARATVGARQQAAQAVGGARVANAGDMREIATRGATGERSIAEALAAQQSAIAGLGAGGNRDLTNALATGRRTIGDTGANSLFGITNTNALARAGIGAQSANTTFADQIAGADQKRAIADALARGQYELAATLSAQTLDANRLGNAAAASYRDQDYARRMAASLGLTQLPSTFYGAAKAGDDYANSGLNRTLNTLNWWQTPNSTPPTPGATATQPGTAGNSVSGLGAGLLNFGANAFDWKNWLKGVGTPAGATVSTDDPGS